MLFGESQKRYRNVLQRLILAFHCQVFLAYLGHSSFYTNHCTSRYFDTYSKFAQWLLLFLFLNRYCLSSRWKNQCFGVQGCDDNCFAFTNSLCCLHELANCLQTRYSPCVVYFCYYVNFHVGSGMKLFGSGYSWAFVEQSSFCLINIGHYQLKICLCRAFSNSAFESHFNILYHEGLEKLPSLVVLNFYYL